MTIIQINRVIHLKMALFETMAFGKGTQVPRSNFHVVMLVCAAYGIIHVLSKNIGLQIPKKQKDLVQLIPVQIMMYYSAAYVVTDDYMLSVICVGIFLFLRFVYSCDNDTDDRS